MILKIKNEKIFNKYKPIGIFNLAAETHVDRSIDLPKILSIAILLSLTF